MIEFNESSIDRFEDLFKSRRKMRPDAVSDRKLQAERKAARAKSMSVLSGKDAPKKCKFKECKKRFYRKRYENGRLEGIKEWRARRFCSVSCCNSMPRPKCFSRLNFSFDDNAKYRGRLRTYNRNELVKFCGICEEVIERKRFPGGALERFCTYRERKFCSKKCCGEAKKKNVASLNGKFSPGQGLDDKGLHMNWGVPCNKRRTRMSVSHG